MQIPRRKFFLERLELAYNTTKKLERLTRPGLRGKAERLIFLPNIYIPYILWRTNFYARKNRKIKLFWGRTIESDIDDHDIFMLHSLGMLTTESEYRLTKFFIKHLNDHDVFYDIGANYGFYTYLALEFSKEVHAFEPLPQVLQCLERNLRHNGKVFLNNVAVSDERGFAAMYSPNRDDVGRSTINPEIKNLFDEFPHEQKIIRVETITLGDYFKSRTKPTVLKLDVEGSEAKIIRGCKIFFQDGSPTIAMEVGGGKAYKVSERAIIKLRSLGYHSYLINLDGELEEIDGDLSHHVNSRVRAGFDNFIFKK